jgi:hypothetical protein
MSPGKLMFSIVTVIAVNLCEIKRGASLSTGYSME